MGSERFAAGSAVVLAVIMAASGVPATAAPLTGTARINDGQAVQAVTTVAVREGVAPDRKRAPLMPNLVGMVVQDAQDLLQSKGSFLMRQYDATGHHRFLLLDANWKVCAQRPAPGVVLDPLTIVRLYAVKLDESCR